MDNVQIIQSIGLGIALVLLVLMTFRRATSTVQEPLVEKVAALKTDIERLDRIVREDGAQARDGADERGRLLREEVVKSLADSRQELILTTGQLKTDISNSLTQAVELLRSTLSDLGAAQQEKLNAVALQLGDLTKAFEGKLESIRVSLSDSLKELREASANSAKEQREETQRSLTDLGTTMREQAKNDAEAQTQALTSMVARVDRLAVTNSESLEKVRETLSTSMTALQRDNNEKLDKMRETVDEKLQGTLEKRLGESFKLVGDRLEQVHRGLGEMQSLAMGVGDLKRVLTNVKVRGTWGETQLGNLLAQVFSPEQYHANHPTKPGASERVEFAVRLPGRGPDDVELLLPIDAKFPREDYERLVEAAEIGDAEAVEACSKLLENRIKASAKDILDKYIHPPHTTDFAILFLPTEGLYAEILRRPGLADTLQRDFRVLIAGPTSLNALINSLQMGFRTLAIQQRSSEVWEVLGAVKAEFSSYGGLLAKVRKKLTEASNVVDKVAVRHRAVDRSLKEVSQLPDGQAKAVLALPDVDFSLDEEEVDSERSEAEMEHLL